MLEVTFVLQALRFVMTSSTMAAEPIILHAAK